MLRQKRKDGSLGDQYNCLWRHVLSKAKFSLPDAVFCCLDATRDSYIILSVPQLNKKTAETQV